MWKRMMTFTQFAMKLDWQCTPFHLQQLISNLDRDLQYAIKVEGKMDIESVSNYDEVKNAITAKVLFVSIVNFRYFIKYWYLVNP